MPTHLPVCVPLRLPVAVLQRLHAVKHLSKAKAYNLAAFCCRAVTGDVAALLLLV
jgi:hypothetical protein